MGLRQGVHGIHELVPRRLQLLEDAFALRRHHVVLPGRACWAFSPPIPERTCVLHSGQQRIYGALHNKQVYRLKGCNDVGGIGFAFAEDAQNAQALVPPFAFAPSMLLWILSWLGNDTRFSLVLCNTKYLALTTYRTDLTAAGIFACCVLKSRSPSHLCPVRIHIATGSNLGDRLNHLDEADRRMAPKLGRWCASPRPTAHAAVGMAPGRPTS